MHSLRGVLYLPAIILQQVPLLHRRQVGGGAEVQVVAVDKDLMGSGAGHKAGCCTGLEALVLWWCLLAPVHLLCLFYAVDGSVKTHSNQLTHPLCPLLTRLELGGRGAVRSAHHCDARQLDGAVEGDVQQQLWVVLFTV